MRSQARRDETTLQIFTALLLFVAVLVGGGVLLGFAGKALDVAEPLARWLFAALACAAASAAVAYLVRRRRDG